MWVKTRFSVCLYSPLVSLLQCFWVVSGDQALNQLGLLLRSRTAEEWLPWKVNNRIGRMEHRRARGKRNPLGGTLYHRQVLQEASSLEQEVWFPPSPGDAGGHAARSLCGIQEGCVLYQSTL